MVQGQIYIANASNRPKWSDATHPDSVSQGDLLYASSNNVYSNLTKDANASRYLSNTGTSNNPAWAQVNLSNGVTSTLGATNGGTSQSTYTTGDIIYASAANTLSKLAIGSANQVLTVIGGIPSWQPASGGSGISSLTTDTSGPVSPNAGAVDCTGTNVYSDGSVANTLTLNLQGTNHGLFVGRGTTTPSANLSVGASGTVLIGNTGADPSFSATPNVTSISFSGGNALSNYTEGTFTPTFIGGTTAGTTTYTLQQGIYRRIGNLVYCHVSITTTASTGTGSISMGGFPFIPRGALVYTGYGVISNTGWTWPAGTTSCYFELFATTQGVFRFYGSGTNVLTLNMQNTAMLIRFDIVYPI